jgi:anthranilate synthase component 2
MILLIDNYDSFVYNLARYFERLGQSTHVVRNDAITVEEAKQLAPDAIVLSPGPCTPAEAGCCIELVQALHASTPMLGVCLGHQAIAAALGGRIVRARQPMHGRTSLVTHDGQDEFHRLPNPLTACRYHSLVVEEASLPECLEVTARSDDGEVMALRHGSLPVVGVQFHPESILTDHGYGLLGGFLRRAGLVLDGALPSADDERPPRLTIEKPLPTRPVTF